MLLIEHLKKWPLDITYIEGRSKIVHKLYGPLQFIVRLHPHRIQDQDVRLPVTLVVRGEAKYRT